MATVSFQQTDTAVACALAAFCSALGLTGGASAAEQASQGGTAGTATNSPALVKGETNVIAVGFECVVPSNATWAAGNWTVRLNVTVANSNLTWTEVFICRISSGCVSQATIGSATALGISLGTTGVKSTTVSGAVQTPAAGDKVYIVLAFTNSKTVGANQTFSYVANQLIDSPFTATQSLSATLSDTTSPSDSLAQKVALKQGLSDTTSPSDSLTAARGIKATLSDTTTTSDSLSVKAALKVSISDSTAPSDSLAAKAGLHFTITDSTSPSESIALAFTPATTSWTRSFLFRQDESKNIGSLRYYPPHGPFKTKQN